MQKSTLLKHQAAMKAREETPKRRRDRKVLNNVRQVYGQSNWERMLADEAEISKYQPRSSWPLIVRYAMLFGFVG